MGTSSTLITGPTAEPVTISEAKSHLRITGTDSDVEVAQKIPRARQMVEAYTRRALISQTWEFTYDREWPCVNGYYKIELPMQPVSSVSFVTYVDPNGDEQTMSASDYQVVGAGSENNCYLVPAYGVTWPAVRCIPEAITVRAIVGYGTPSAVPGPLREAVLLYVERLYDRDATEEPTTLMDPYRRV